MKKLLMSSAVLAIFALSIILFQMSCTKDSSATPTTLTKDEILVQKTWKVDQVNHVISGAYTKYVNGGTNTTGVNYNNLRYTFNSDGTGIHVSETGATYPTSWHFSTTDKRNLVLTVHAGTEITNTWEMLEIADNYLHGSSHFGSNDLESFRLVQVP